MQRAIKLPSTSLASGVSRLSSLSSTSSASKAEGGRGRGEGGGRGGGDVLDTMITVYCLKKCSQSAIQ